MTNPLAKSEKAEIKRVKYVCEGKGGGEVLTKTRLNLFTAMLFGRFSPEALFLTHFIPKIFTIEDLYDQM